MSHWTSGPKSLSLFPQQHNKLWNRSGVYHKSTCRISLWGRSGVCHCSPSEIVDARVSPEERVQNRTRELFEDVPVLQPHHEGCRGQCAGVARRVLNGVTCTGRKVFTVSHRDDHACAMDTVGFIKASTSTAGDVMVPVLQIQKVRLCQRSPNPCPRSRFGNAWCWSSRPCPNTEFNNASWSR